MAREGQGYPCYQRDMMMMMMMVVWVWLGDPFVSQNPRRLFASHSPEKILDCAYTICS